jgi:hypothetical protein
MYDTPELKKKEKVPTLFIELIDQRDSGWVLDGTAGTKNETRLTCPSAEFIPSRGFRLAKGTNLDSGEEEFFNEEIRYIKNQRVLSVVDQNIKGIRPSRNKVDDKIIIKGGNFSVAREGAFIGLFDYLVDVFYNGSNPNRPESAKALYKVKEVGKEDEELSELEIMQADAVQYIKKFFYKQGDKHKYDEAKINALCNMFMIFAESPAAKVRSLIAFAKKDPQEFLNKAMRFEQTIVTELATAIELSVVKFEGNALVYCNKERVILDIGRGNMKHETKILKAAEILGTEEYKDAYVELQIELESAIEKQTK